MYWIRNRFLTAEIPPQIGTNELADLVALMRGHGWKWASSGVVSGLCGGMLSAILGSILTAIAWFTGPVWHGFSLRSDGTVLLFLTIPLLIFGAHCLDLIDKRIDKTRRPQHQLGQCDIQGGNDANQFGKHLNKNSSFLEYGEKS